MDNRKRPDDPAEATYAGLEDATAGFDCYLSDLINGEGNAERSERRRKPRGGEPDRHRAALVTGTKPGDTDQ